MQQVSSDVSTFRGTHYDYGVATGQWLQQTAMLKNREKEWKKRVPRFDIDVEKPIKFSNSSLLKYGMKFKGFKMC